MDFCKTFSLLYAGELFSVSIQVPLSGSGGISDLINHHKTLATNSTFSYNGKARKKLCSY